MSNIKRWQGCGTRRALARSWWECVMAVTVELSSKTEHMRVFNSISKYTPDRNVCIFLPKDLHLGVHSSALLISPKLEITQTPTNG